VEFGLSTHLFHGDRLVRDQVKAIADHGFGLVEVFATRTHFDYHDPRAAEEVRGWIEDCGLSAWSVHAPICDGFRDGVWGRAYSNASRNAATREEAVHETLASVEATRRLGAGVLVLHLGLPIGQPIPADDNDRAAAARALDPIVAACDRSGVRLALEVIPNDLATAESVAAWLEGEPSLGRTGACLDVGHAHLTGGAPDAVERLAAHVITTHIHDNRGRTDDHLLPFEGTIDWPATMGAFTKVGYRGPLIFELPDHGSASRVLARAAAARDRIQAILDDIRAPLPWSDDQ
jgi:sugar phosphate isomerase/epimerase